MSGGFAAASMLQGLGSFMGGSLQAKAAKSGMKKLARAMNRSTQAQLDMFNRARKDMAPYREAGYKALEEMYELDPTAGAAPYMEQFEELEFKFDPDDEIYKWRQEQNEKAVNRFMASRGGYDSRVALNALTESGMQLQENEISRQFNQRYLTKYNQLSQLYNMARSEGATRYGQLADIANLGSGHAMGSANAAITTGQNVGNTLMQGAAGQARYNQLGAAAQAQGIMGLANIPMNALSASKIWGGTGSPMSVGSPGGANALANRTNNAANPNYYWR